MAEKKPISLNERNERLLKGLSSSRHNHRSQDEGLFKVKLEGRRRLCKFSSRPERPESPPDFDSPHGSTRESESIRDILNDLSSRMEELSIQKNKVSKNAEISEEFLIQMPDKGAENEEIDTSNDPEYLSVSSSFSSTSPKSNCDSDSSVKEEKCTIARKITDSNWLSSTPKGGAIPSRNNIENFTNHDIHSFSASDENDCITQLEKQIYHTHQFREVIESPISSSASHSSNQSLPYEDNDDIFKLDGPSSSYMLPGKIAKMLYPHQRDGLKWLWSLHCRGPGGILGDDMGLGKTMQVSAFLAGLFHSNLIKRALIVAPKTLLSHWIKELSVVGLSEKIREYFGTSAKVRQYELQYVLQDKGILLTTYDIVRNNSKSLRGECISHEDISEDTMTWDYIILDEGHIIKNPSTQRAKSLLEIPSAHRVIISGTPLQNNLKELWALFYFCCPEVLGDKKEFKDRYEYAILRGNDKNASDREKRIGSTVAKELRERIGPYFLRRMKNQVFGENGEGSQSATLSKKFEIIVWLKLTPCQRQLYEAFLRSELVRASIAGSPLAALTVLKKICDHPLLLTKRAAESVLEGLDEENLDHKELGMMEQMALHLATISSEDSQRSLDSVSCKISFVLALVENLVRDGHHVLIFSQSRKMLNLIQESIELQGYAFLRIDGTTKALERERIVNDFQEGNAVRVFLLTTQVGGLGLTLTRASRVIVIDPAWNPSTDNQSVDRAYRIGQSKDVLVYRLMTCGTIEEKIYKMQVFKGGLFKSATEHREQMRYFSQKDLREMFSLPEQGFDISLTQKQLSKEHGYQQTMDVDLKNHIKFLQSQGIAGISHHNLLFSKPMTLPLVPEDNERDFSKNAMIPMRRSSSSSQDELNGNWSDYALHPKDGKISTKVASSVTNEDGDIKEKISRLCQTFANKALVSKLPDQGERLQKQIIELNVQLERIMTPQGKEVVDLEDTPS